MNTLLQKMPKLSTLVVVLLLGLLIGRCFTPIDAPADPGSSTQAVAAAPETWTCSMHPTVQAPSFGTCPICAMDLIPSVAGAGPDLGDFALRLEDGQKALSGIQTTLARRASAAHQVRLIGKLAVDETAIATLSAYVGGRLDRLYVDYTGIKVRAGDHLAEIYSPQLFHAQEELIVAVESAKRFGTNADESLAKISHSTVVAARKKLTLYGLTEEQMEEIVEKGEPAEQITLNAPMGGTVIHRNAVEGQYVKEGDPLYTIADLDHLWLELDAYESDLPWMRYGQKVRFEVDAWPGETFEGTISFLDPVLDPVTRTVHVRVEVDNSDGRLRPAMYARAIVETEVASEGAAAAIDLTGMWMCPMHPEVLGSEEGSCSICGMPLETAESLGFVEDQEGGLQPLLIPITAPLLTGDRAVVFVERPDLEQEGASIFEARDITLGPRAGDDFIVLDGLEEGASVVSRGAFLIDSELQLRGKRSMMAPPSELMLRMEESPEDFRNGVGVLLTAAAELGERLASDDFSGAKVSLKQVQASLEILKETQGPDSAAELLEDVASAATRMGAASEVEAFRVAMEDLQAALIALTERYGYAGTERAFAVYHCPMALEDGADWIDFEADGIRNPYYGASMLKCGTEKRTLAASKEH